MIPALHTCHFRRFLLANYCLFALAWGAHPLAAQAEPTDSLWSNSVQEFGAVLSSPAEGSWQGYFIALGFAGALAVSLNHDVAWYQDVQSQRNDWQDKVMPPLTLLGDGLVHIGAYGALYKFGNDYDKRVAAMAMEGLVNVAVVSTILKFSFTATRPEVTPDHRDWFTADIKNLSFPSGHTMTAFCAAAIFGDAYHVEWLTFPLAAAVGYSRIYNRKHWPSDVIAGAGLGILIGYTVRAFHEYNPAGTGVRFSVIPEHDGGKVVASWSF